MANVESGSDGPNVDVNIVPFIDLMSVLITFLLITAVWTQVSMIQIGSSIHGKSQADQEQPKPEEDKELRLNVRKDGYLLRFGTQAFKFPKIGGQYDKKSLRAKLKDIKENNPDKNDAMIAVDNDLDFETFISGMDTLLHEKFANVSVVTGDIK